MSQQTEDTAKQREQLRVLAMVAARTDNAVILTNPQGLTEWVNEGFTRLTGYPLEEVRGRKPGAVLQGPETSPDTVRYMRESLAQGLSFNTEILNYARDGRPYWVQVEVQPLFDEQGQLTHFMAIERDITARKRSEELLRQQDEALRRHRDQLEERVWETARQLEAQQVQLIQAEKMASLGQMAAGIAHEVNNPMGYITSNLNSLGDYARTLVRLLRLYRGLEEDVRSGQPPSQELLERIRALQEEEQVEALLVDVEELIQDCKEGAHRVIEIVQGLRMFSRTDEGTLQPSDLNKVMDATLKLVRHQIKYKCEVRCDYGPLPLVACHPTQVSQVFTNLLVNAAQAIDTRGEIRITTRHEGGQVVVRVADTGSGMTPETQARLFTPFFTTKPAGTGTGLGLSICSSIIQRHQGRIEVQSEPGKGSTFIVRLPVMAG